MPLIDLIRKRITGASATATPAIPAIPATRRLNDTGTVAEIAGIAVAKPEVEKIAARPSTGADGPTISYRRWQVSYPDRDPVTVICVPEVTLGEMQNRYPDAVQVEPALPTVRLPSAPMTDEEEESIQAWLAQIGETDSAVIVEVLLQCQNDADTREYFVGRARTDGCFPNQHADNSDDERRTCMQCVNLVGRRCLAAMRGELATTRDYEPIRDMLQRCAGYAPGVNDPDRRHGSERWPGLVHKNQKE